MCKLEESWEGILLTLLRISEQLLEKCVVIVSKRREFLEDDLFDWVAKIRFYHKTVNETVRIRPFKGTSGT